MNMENNGQRKNPVNCCVRIGPRLVVAGDKTGLSAPGCVFFFFTRKTGYCSNGRGVLQQYCCSAVVDAAGLETMMAARDRAVATRRVIETLATGGRGAAGIPCEVPPVTLQDRPKRQPYLLWYLPTASTSFLTFCGPLGNTQTHTRLTPFHWPAGKRGRAH